MAKRRVVGIWLLLNTNGKPYPRNSTGPFSTTYRDPQCGILATFGPPPAISKTNWDRKFKSGKQLLDVPRSMALYKTWPLGGEAWGTDGPIFMEWVRSISPYYKSLWPLLQHMMTTMEKQWIMNNVKKVKKVIVSYWPLGGEAWGTDGPIFMEWVRSISPYYKLLWPLLQHMMTTMEKQWIMNNVKKVIANLMTKIHFIHSIICISNMCIIIHSGREHDITEVGITTVKKIKYCYMICTQKHTMFSAKSSYC